MIKKLTLTNFKNFQQASLSLGKLSVLIGTNASGKSNIREAFRFLHGVARGYSLADIFGEKWDEGYLQWRGIRGGYREACFHGTHTFEISVVIDEFSYTIQVEIDETRVEPIRVVRESLQSEQEMCFSTLPDDGEVGQSNHVAQLAVRLPSANGNRKHEKILILSASRPALLQVLSHAQTPREIKDEISHVFAALLRMRFIDLSPEAMRMPTNPGQTILGDHGENFSSVLQALCAKENIRHAMLEWVRQLTPMDVEDFEFRSDLSGRIVLFIKEHDSESTSAYSVSDGTLRFLGLIAAMIDPLSAGLFFLEEIENGIHPTRLGVLIKFLEQRISQNKHDTFQVVTTTHSPQLLRFLNLENRESASLIYRLEDAPDARIKRLMDIPSIQEVLTQTDMADLLESGWFENVVSFLADEEQPQ